MNDVALTLRDLADVMEGLGLTYAVIGGIAVRAYGIPRPTFDLDFTLAIPRDRLPELFGAVEKRGYSVPDSYQTGWVDPVAKMPLVKVRCYLQGQGVDVDMFLAETPFQQEVLKRRQLVETPDGNAWLATPEDVVLLKLLANRPRDILDVNDILFTLGELDRDYLRTWDERLGVRSGLDDVLRQYDETI
ncbi:MAG: hypothetical protein CMJ64_05665 [Planctomycetaceae bacterium]|nr:hypothetical protein [Planctomycetaceae bacterium]